MIKQIQNPYSIYVAVNIRIGYSYHRIKKFLNNNQYWNKAKIESWQLKKLKKIISYAYKNVTGYRELYDKAGVKPTDIVCLEDIKNLPFITKQMLSDNLKDFTSKTMPSQSMYYVTTSGSTGIPLGFYQTRLNGIIEEAFIHHNWEKVGWQRGIKSVVLRGKFVGSNDQFWQYDDENPDLLLSSYYLTESNYDRYIQKILEYQPLYLKAYPSMVTSLADLIIQKGDIGIFNFQRIFLGSENIYPWQKKRISQAFPQAKIFGWYGQTEKVILAAMCPFSDEFHISPFYGYTEIFNKDKNEVKKGEQGELIGTSFWNYSTPFIRYRTMDLAKKGHFGCDKCHLQFQLLTNIEGRLQDTLISQNGRRIPLPSTSIHSNVFDQIKQFQFHQTIPGSVILRVIPKKTYTNRDTSKVRNEIMKKLGHDMNLKIQFVKKIQKTASGKYRCLDQKLNIW